jgi:SnoaL-like domain
MNPGTLQQIVDRVEIQDCLCRYARGVDRGDWALVRSSYHPDATDQHGDYRGDIDGLIDWLDKRFAGVDNSMHFLGNCLIEFAAPDFAFVETYFASRRLRLPTVAERAGLADGDMMCREAWGRYLDHFERRDGAWRVVQRVVVIETAYTSVALGGRRSPGSPTIWSRRDGSDLTHHSRAELFAKSSAAA